MSERPPTPIGWSDTDWIKKLQGDEESPLACLHINQGSFDAAADAYEEEYKMSKRTAPDIALDLDAASCSSFVKLEAAESLRKQRAEIDSLKRERHHIYDLLARIHRDGGQYTAEHGVEKACDDAEAQVVTWLDTINGIDALIEQARIAERAAHSMLIAAAHASLFAVDEDVASIIMLALDTVQKATGEKP
jgi:hypothetical protein